LAGIDENGDRCAAADLFQNVVVLAQLRAGVDGDFDTPFGALFNALFGALHGDDERIRHRLRRRKAELEFLRKHRSG